MGISKAFTTCVFVLALLAAPSHAATINVTDVDGAWQNPLPSVPPPTPPITISNGETLSTIRWGNNIVSSETAQSGYDFHAAIPPAVAESVPPQTRSDWVTLGEFTHWNYAVDGDSLTSVELKVTIDLNIDGGANIPLEFLYIFTHEETGLDADNVGIAFPSSQTFQVNGITYLVELAFGRGNTEPGTIVSAFSTDELESTTLGIWAQFTARGTTETPVPEPTSITLVALGVLCLLARVRHRGRR